jgi:hypothetical protein
MDAASSTFKRDHTWSDWKGSDSEEDYWPNSLLILLFFSYFYTSGGSIKTKLVAENWPSLKRTSKHHFSNNHKIVKLSAPNWKTKAMIGITPSNSNFPLSCWYNEKGCDANMDNAESFLRCWVAGWAVKLDNSTSCKMS